jgi:iron complex transport system substrate-binding protein
LNQKVGITRSLICTVGLLGGLTISCGTDPAHSIPGTTRSIDVMDDAGLVVHLDRPAQRVISLIPSATETLIALGAVKQIVARTRYDVAPEVAALPSVGGSIDPSVEAIVNLKPDVVIVWESDKRQAVRQKLEALHVVVFVLRSTDTTDVFRELGNLGRLTGHDSTAAAMASSVRSVFDSVRISVVGRPRPSVFYVVFNDPPMTTGPNTFIGQLISLAGARSIFDDSKTPWPNVSMEEIIRRDPDILIVPLGALRGNAVERFQQLAGWRNLRAVREGRVVSVPADLMNRPGPGIAEAARVLRAAVHPEVVSR